jgi:ATP-dependent Clp protease ATP-binding subunit ClpB
VRRRPYAVILVDEIEKAHHDVFNIFLQILDEGRLTDSKGRVVDFKNTLIIMTSNLGTSYISNESIPMDERRKGVEQELKINFKPEFLNRVDEIIIFNPLNLEMIKEITVMQLNEVGKRLKEKGIHLELSKKALDRITEIGYDPQFGARPLKRAIQKYIINPLSVRLLEGNIEGEQKVKVDVSGQDFVFK